ncbi:MAG: phosphatase PAP2 family protein [Desulfurococcales archaeon]|nr:phosphatase PAP2 family protein [Desulfurococcales archaeon]
MPFAVIFILYEASRSIAFRFNSGVTYGLPLSFEEHFFGAPLAVFFQLHRVWLLDVFCSIIYSLHPLYLFILILYLLVFDLDNYIHALVTVGTASLIAVATYIVWPVAPPWIAYPGITRIQNIVFRALGLEKSIDPNPYAAMPSMHVAYSFFFYYYIKKAFGNKHAKLLLIGYFMVIAVPFTVIYTGNHYLLDVIAGFIVALVSVKIGDIVLRIYSRP